MVTRLSGATAETSGMRWRYARLTARPIVMISKFAIVESDRIGSGVRIGEFAIIRKGATLGDGAVIHPHVVIGPGVEVGAGAEVFPGAVLGKEPKGAGASARAIAFRARVLVGPGCSIGPHAVLFYDVEIGAGTLLGDGASVREQSRIGQKCIISRYVTLNYEVTVGDGVKIMDNTHITGKTWVGHRAFISTGVSTANDNALGHNGYNDGSIRGPRIEEEAMVGANAILLPGVVIGRGAVVAAGAVVTRDVAPGSVVMGIPARAQGRPGAQAAPGFVA
jgi:acetyltransferase-like isoleucine patch superfamily enzyme